MYRCLKLTLGTIAGASGTPAEFLDRPGWASLTPVECKLCQIYTFLVWTVWSYSYLKNVWSSQLQSQHPEASWRLRKLQRSASTQRQKQWSLATSNTLNSINSQCVLRNCAQDQMKNMRNIWRFCASFASFATAEFHIILIKWLHSAAYVVFTNTKVTQRLFG